MQGPIILLKDIEELSTSLFNSPAALESELKDPSPVIVDGDGLHARTTDDKFYTISFTDDRNKTLVGLVDTYLHAPSLVGVGLVEAWVKAKEKRNGKRKTKIRKRNKDKN